MSHCIRGISEICAFLCVSLWIIVLHLCKQGSSLSRPLPFTISATHHLLSISLCIDDNDNDTISPKKCISLPLVLIFCSFILINILILPFPLSAQSTLDWRLNGVCWLKWAREPTFSLLISVAKKLVWIKVQNYYLYFWLVFFCLLKKM